MQNSVAVFTFSVLDLKNLFWANLVKKNQNCQFKLKFGTKTNLNMQNSMIMLTFPAFDHKYPSRANLVQKFKIVQSEIDWIQLPFLGKFGPKNHKSQFKLKIGTYTNSNMKNSMVIFIFFCIFIKYLFVENLFQKLKLFVEAEIKNLD